MPSSNINLIKKIIFRRLYAGNILVGVSQAVSDAVKKFYCGEKVITIENAIYFPRLNEVDSVFKKDVQSISFLTMGYNYWVKGVDLSIQALAQLKNKYDIVLYIAVASHKEELLKKVKELNAGIVPAWIKFLPPTDKIGAYYKNVDFFLSPSRSEGFCYAVVEAAYCQATVIASKIPAQGALEVDNVYWFESENIEDYIKVIELAIANREKDEDKKMDITKKVVDRYALSRWATQIIALLKEYD